MFLSLESVMWTWGKKKSWSLLHWAMRPTVKRQLTSWKSHWSSVTSNILFLELLLFMKLNYMLHIICFLLELRQVIVDRIPEYACWNMKVYMLINKLQPRNSIKSPASLRTLYIQQSGKVWKIVGLELLVCKIRVLAHYVMLTWK